MADDLKARLRARARFNRQKPGEVPTTWTDADSDLDEFTADRIAELEAWIARPPHSDDTNDIVLLGIDRDSWKARAARLREALAPFALFYKSGKHNLSVADADMIVATFLDQETNEPLAELRLSDFRSAFAALQEPADEQNKQKCEFTHCISGGGAVALHVNECIDDGTWRIGICQPCASAAGLKDGDDFDDPWRINDLLLRAKEPADD